MPCLNSVRGIGMGHSIGIKKRKSLPTFLVFEKKKKERLLVHLLEGKNIINFTRLTYLEEREQEFSASERGTLSDVPVYKKKTNDQLNLSKRRRSSFRALEQGKKKKLASEFAAEMQEEVPILIKLIARKVKR